MHIELQSFQSEGEGVGTSALFLPPALPLFGEREVFAPGAGAAGAGAGAAGVEGRTEGELGAIFVVVEMGKRRRRSGE